MLSTPLTGAPSLFTLFSSDVDKVVPFYHGLFGWEADAAPYGYRFAVDGDEVARAVELDAAQDAPGWFTYFAVNDIDQALADVVAIGGTQTSAPGDRELDSPSGGRLAHIKDPTGAPAGLWAQGDAPATGIGGGIGRVIWVEEKTRDQRTATDFFGSLLHISFLGPGGTGKVRPFKVGASIVGGIMEFDDRWTVDEPSHWLLYFEVSDPDQTAQRALELGGSVWFPTFQTPIGPITYLRDPVGNAFAAVALSEQGKEMTGS